MIDTSTYASLGKISLSPLMLSNNIMYIILVTTANVKILIINTDF